MISRNTIVKIHLILASLLMPFLLLMPLSGTMYLLDFKGEVKNQLAFTTSAPIPKDNESRKAFFLNEFKNNNLNYNFEYIKDAGKELIFRPTSKNHYTALIEPDGRAIVYKSEPNFIKKIIELHKGHGPKYIRILEIIFGFSLILISFSGVWIATITKPYRTPMIASVCIGALIVIFCLF